MFKLNFAVSDARMPNKSDELEAYKNQMVEMSAFELEARGKKSSYDEVWSALVSLWSKDLAGNELEKQESLVCAVHGWTLFEVYDLAFRSEMI